MKKIILIHAHKNIDQLNELIDILFTQNHRIYVNLDKKSNLNPFEVNSKAKLIKKRINVEWGTFSQVKATLIALNEILQNEKVFEHLIFISGQDFPIKSNKQIDEKLIPGKEYLDYTTTSKQGWDFASRFELYHFGNKPYQKELSSILNRRVMTPLRLRRKFPYDMTPYAGANWWILTRDCIEHVLDFIKNHPRYLKFFRVTKCSDEIFFQTIILNSHFANNVENSSLRYVDWSESKKLGTSSPNILGIEDYEKIMASSNLFCRKIDIPYSRELIEKIKETITVQKETD